MRKGFTLIELLIVITIMAILAGAAVPYVQDYVEDARIAKCREDLGELRNAIMRYEVERAKLFDPANDGIGDTPSARLDNWQQMLVGPFLTKALTDPWGRPYYFSNAASLVFSGAEDGDKDTNIISVECRAAMAPTRAWWYDNNRSGKVDLGDVIDIKFTRPLANDVKLNCFGIATNPADMSKWTTITGVDEINSPVAHPKGINWLRFNVTADDCSIIPGSMIAASSTNYLHDAAKTSGSSADDLYSKITAEAHFKSGNEPAAATCSSVVIPLKAAQ